MNGTKGHAAVEATVNGVKGVDGNEDDYKVFEATDIERIGKLAARARAAYASRKTKDVEFRKQQLRKLYWSIKDHEQEFVEASIKDMGKPVFEIVSGETLFERNDILYTLKHIDSWVKDEKAPGLPLTMSVATARTRKEPLGCCLIIGPFNYPMICTLGPLVGAIAAGNTAIIKFSERVPTTALVLRKIVEKALDPDCYSVVQGAIPETTALLKEKWDKIFFTGSDTVGRVVARAAAEHLTPVTLELGGRNPAVVTKTANIKNAARRLLWGKNLNGGQACVSQNYILVDRSVQDRLISELKDAYKEFFPSGTESHGDTAYLGPGSLPRVQSLLDSSKGQIILGGHTDKTISYLAPTIVVTNNLTEDLVVKESFAPILTLVPYDSLPEALSKISSVHSTPLALYAFSTSKPEIEAILSSCTSGGVTINDSIMHGGIPSLRFGGVGDSGTGSYRGKASFDCFTHERIVLEIPNWMEFLLRKNRYPPYSEGQLKSYLKLAEGKPNFDREGNVKVGWIGWILSGGGLLGGGR